MTLPLEGTVILDMSRYLPGGYCTMVLADMGAEVIKVEQPFVEREAALPAPGEGADRKRELAFRSMDRNKKSIALNLKSPEAKQILCKLVEKADVVVESNRPLVAKRLGVDYETLSEVNPRIIYCSITGYGQDGPYRDLPGHDINYMALTGALSVLNEGGRPPIVAGLKIADIGGGSLQAIIGILLALAARDKTGRGQYVDIAMADGIASWLVMPSALYFESGQVPEPGIIPLDGKRPGYNAYQTKDGKYISLGLREPHLFANFCKAIGREDLIPDQNTPGPRREQVIAELKEVLLTRTRDEWFQYLIERDVSVCPVNTLDGAFSDPHMLHRKMVVELEHPVYGKVRQLGIPIKLSDTPGEIKSFAPAVGENTKEILLGLGYPAEEIEGLQKSGAIQ